MAASSAVLAAAVALLLLAGGAEGYARLHTRSCDEMPTRALYPTIVHNSGGLEATLTDGEGGATFEVQSPTGEMVTTYSPGGPVVVHASVPSLAAAVALVPVGRLLDSSGKPAEACGGRRMPLGESVFTGYLPSNPTRRFVFVWEVPEGTMGDVTLSLGYSDRSSNAIMDARLTLSQGKPYAGSAAPVVVKDLAAPAGIVWETVALEVLATAILLGYLSCLVVGQRLLHRAGLVPWLNRWLYTQKGSEGGLATLFLPGWVTVGDVVVVMVTGAFLVLAFMLPSSSSSLVSRLGWVCTMAMTITMLPTGQRSFFAALHRVPFDQMVQMHRWSGRAFTVLAFAHGIHSGCVWGWERIARMMSTFQVTGGYNYTLCMLSGVLSFLLFAVVAVTGAEPVRRRCWEAFRYAHHLVVPAVVFAVLHAPRSVWVVSITLAAWLVDGVWRLWGKDYAYEGTLRVLPGGAVRVHVPGKGLRFSAQRAGQYVLLRFPKADKLQWHPITIASSPLDDCLDFILKAEGAWGRALALHAGGEASAAEEPGIAWECPTPEEGEDGQSPRHPCLDPAAVKRAWLGPGLPTVCNIDGPYGGVPVGVLRKDVVLLVAGGVGVTPMLSTASYLCAWAEAGGGVALPHVHFVWMARGREPFNEWEPELLRRMAALPSFSVHLFDSTAEAEGRLGDSEAPDEKSIPIYPGRCSLDQRFGLQQLVQAHHDRERALAPAGVGMYLCGPASLRASGAGLARAEGYMMHVEKFEW